jgi:hypothetical protein
MRKIIYIISFLSIVFQLHTYSQVVDGITYQAVAIDEKGVEIPGVDLDGNILYDNSISVRFSIISEIPEGTIEYQEVHSTNTDYNGLFSLVIGHGEVTAASQKSSLSEVNWGANIHYLRVELDINQDGNFKVMGIQQMMAVPYALHALSTSDVVEGPQGVGIESIDNNGDGTFTINLSDESSYTTPDFTGANGEDGVGIASIVNNGDGTFSIYLTNGNTFTSDDLTGPQGDQGVGIEDITNNGNGTFTISLSDGSSFTTSNLTGPQGQDGNGITSIIDNEDGSFTINLTNGTSFTSSDLTGAQGDDGVGITSIVNNGNGTFTIFLSNGTSFISDDLTGPQGIDGVGITSIIDNSNGTFTINLSDGNSFTSADLTGDDGVGISSITNNGDGTFTMHLSNGNSWTTDDFTGPDGADGRSFLIKGQVDDPSDLPVVGNVFGDGYFVGVDKELYYWGQYIDALDQWVEGWVNYGELIGLEGPQGQAGVGIVNTTDNGNGTFTFHYSNGTTYTTSVLSGADGEDGVGITSTTNNGDGTFTINYSDGSSFTTSDFSGEDGVGIETTVDNGDGTFTLNYTDGSSFTTIDFSGEDGTTLPDGVSANQIIVWDGSEWINANPNYYTQNQLQTDGDAQVHFDNLTNTPTTLDGYGITDALPKSGGNMTGSITATGDETKLSGFSADMVFVNNDSYTLSAADNGKLIIVDFATEISINVPVGLPDGFNTMIVQKGEGKAVFTAFEGIAADIFNRNGYTKTAGQYAIATIVHLGDNIYITSGDMNN